MKVLHEEFYKELLSVEKEIKEALNIDMVFSKFGNEEELISYVEKIINKNGGRATFTKLWSKGRLDLSIEYLILKEKYSNLFSSEIMEKSYKTLHQYGYEVK
ncbi:hypothetical protein [uncultured Clostridium sp.]|uniref:hypothetical protein n=1 Tax=uncultured Clostridium sp. TaxID=59620 RepID=UPI00262160E5|nr:hypothetical protein [uncultured Clostridium sp.]